MFALFGMVFVAIAQGVARQAGLDRTAEILSKWPIVLAGILVLFLLLQLFRLAVPKETKQQTAEHESQETVTGN